jgi:hypothetical protein
MVVASHKAEGFVRSIPGRVDRRRRAKQIVLKKKIKRERSRKKKVQMSETL